MAHEITPVEGDLVEFLNKTCISPIRTGFVRLDGVLLPESCAKSVNVIENFEVRDDDVWVCSFPKTGTTWTQEMVWCIAHDADFETAKLPLTERFPYFELSSICDFTGVLRRNPEDKIPDFLKDSFNVVGKLPSPRFIKCHCPFHLLPRQMRTGEKRPKIIYIVRNAKDTCISYFHHAKLLDKFQGSFDDFCTLFLGDAVVYAPFWGHVLGYWERRFDENVLFLKYEDMKGDLPQVIKRAATFLGKNLTSDQMSILTKHLSFESMSASPASNNENLVAQARNRIKTTGTGKFMRNGTIDQWKTVMSPETIEKFDEWTRKSLKGTQIYTEEVENKAENY